jgi:hypothetical protein
MIDGVSRVDNFRVLSWDVVKIVDGVGSKGYIEIDVIACVWANSCEDLSSSQLSIVIQIWTRIACLWIPYLWAEAMDW